MAEGGEHEDYMHAATGRLLRLGFQAGTRGYRYLRDAIVEKCRTSDDRMSMTKELYPMLAARYGVTDKHVERAIRNAVETVWDQRNEEAWREFCETLGYEREERPTNKEMISTMATMIKRECRT